MAIFKKDGIDLYYEINGSGEPLLIIAGGGADSRYYKGLSNIIEKKFQVILMDPRGSGQSKRGEETYSFDLLVSDIVAILQHIGIHKTHVLGHSMGGMTAMHFAYSHPEYINKIILWSTASHLSAFGKHCCHTANLIRKEHSIEAFVHVMAIWNFSNAFFDEPNNLQELLEGAKQDSYKLSAEVFAEQMEIINAFDCSENLKKLAGGALIIGCEKDIIFPTEGSKQLLSLIKNSIYQEIPNATHSVHIENPHVIAELVKDYLNGF